MVILLFFLYIVLIAISLSVDAFTLSLAIGKYIKQKHVMILTIFVGFFHFIFTILGFSLNMYINLQNKYHSLLTLIIFLILLIKLIQDYFSEKETITYITIISIILISLSVSLDSFFVGLTLKNNIMLSAVTFSTVSLFSTYIGLTIGRYMEDTFGKKFSLLGIITLFILIIYHLYLLFM